MKLWIKRKTPVNSKKINDLRHEIKFENRVKNKNNFFIKPNISFFLTKIFFYSWKSIFFKIPMNWTAKADTKKYRYLSAKASVFADCRGEFRTLKHELLSRHLPRNHQKMYGYISGRITARLIIWNKIWRGFLNFHYTCPLHHCTNERKI